jgi:alkanesulfonate monooxygenase SsuD/methylene tetrahydromethanopterin reductase-like flavin-dependent oxidoreductase (luciferase family)
VAQTKATGEHVNDQVGALVQGYCAATDEQAKEEAAEGNLKWLKLALDGDPRLAKMSKAYAYMGQVKDVQDKYEDYEYFKEGSGAAIIGSPESCIKAIEKFQSIGFDQVLMRIDSVPHDKILKSIEMFGRYVIPHFKNRRNFLRPAEDVLKDIREMREEAKRRGVYVEMEAPTARPQSSKEAVG